MLNSLMMLRAAWRRSIFDISRIITRFGVSASSNARRKYKNEHARTIERIRYMRDVFDDVLHGRHRASRAAPGNGGRSRKK